MLPKQEMTKCVVFKILYRKWHWNGAKIFVVNSTFEGRGLLLDELRHLTHFMLKTFQQ